MRLGREPRGIFDEPAPVVEWVLEDLSEALREVVPGAIVELQADRETQDRSDFLGETDYMPLPPSERWAIRATSRRPYRSEVLAEEPSLGFATGVALLRLFLMAGVTPSTLLTVMGPSSEEAAQ
jgi:hypothetical protein